jgi:hypothetical protein
MQLQLYFRAVSHLSDARFASAAGAEFLGFPWYPSSGDGISQADYIDIRQWISGPVPVLQITARELPLFAFNPTELAKLGQAEQSTICSEKNERDAPAGIMDGLDVPTGMMDFDLNATQSLTVVPDALEVTLSGNTPHAVAVRPDCPIIWKVDAQTKQLPDLFRVDLDYLLLDPSALLTDSNPQPSPDDLPKNWAGLFGPNRCFLEIPTLMQNPMEWVDRFKPYGVCLSGQEETAVGKRDYSAWQAFTDLLEEAGLR